MADFVNKQFEKDEVADKVLEQYDEESTRIFYQCVMGGGGYDIHFGIFREDSWGVLESSKATTDFMMDSMDWAKPVTKDSVVLDLGSGHGGGTHEMVKRFGCKVECFNLGPEQNKMNMDRCKELGIADRVNCHVGNLNDPLPAEWTGKFDFVWSCEVFCHAADKVAILKEISRILKPGGVLVFSDLMGADKAREDQLRAFTDRNATTVMGRPKRYLEAIDDSGLKYLTWWDGSHHLEKYFREMVRQIDENKATMLSKGLTEQYLQNWWNSLTDRAETQKNSGVFAWGVFVARKPLVAEIPTFSPTTKEGIQALNDWVATRSYITGQQASKDDVAVFATMSAPPNEALHPHAHRWYTHIQALLAINFPGKSLGVNVALP